MAKDYWEDVDWADGCCLGCGEPHYHPSRTEGLCFECVSGGVEDDAASVFPWDYEQGSE